jgi:acyl-[acyl-carrier-protein] desaturase
VDPSEMMIAFQYMTKNCASAFSERIRRKKALHSNSFQIQHNALVSIAADYIDIMQKLMTRWEIDKITGLTDEAEKARDYLMKLPARMTRVSERMTIPQESHILNG